MPTINTDDPTTEYGVRIKQGFGPSFVKLLNYEASPYGSSRSRHHEAIHIENEHDRPYGGQSLTFCGRVLETGSYLFVRQWRTGYRQNYRTCKGCHTSAMKRFPDYREAVERVGQQKLGI